jgi:hypothetical protein
MDPKENPMTTYRSKAVAYTALRKRLRPEQLGGFTDAEWESLTVEAEVTHARASELADAVDYLQALYEEKESKP